MTPEDIRLERVTDVERLLPWRMEVIDHVFGPQPTESYRSLLRNNRLYYDVHLGDGSHVAVIATYNGCDIAGGAVCISDEMPSPDNPSGRCAYLMNIYVRLQFRRRGIARRIVEWLTDYARSRGIGKIYLETTEMAEPLYKTVGFTPMEGMMKYTNANES